MSHIVLQDAVQNQEDRLFKIYDVIQQLPPPHYRFAIVPGKNKHLLHKLTHANMSTCQVSFIVRTAEFLFKHLNRVGKESLMTGMHFKNLAIVWGPNVMR